MHDHTKCRNSKQEQKQVGVLHIKSQILWILHLKASGNLEISLVQDSAKCLRCPRILL